MATFNCARLSELGIIGIPQQFSFMEVADTADVNVLRVNTIDCASTTGLTGIIRQGVDCRQHDIQAAGAVPSATPIATNGDSIRHENVFNEGINGERHWLKVANRVRVTMSFFGCQFNDPTRPMRLYTGSLPFRQGAFTSTLDVVGHGFMLTNLPINANASTAMVCDVIADSVARTIPVADVFHPLMAGWTAAQRTFGPGSPNIETPGNAAYIVISMPNSVVNPPAFGSATVFGNVTFEYDADIQTIHEVGYVPPIDPGTGLPYVCPWPAEFIPLLP